MVWLSKERNCCRFNYATFRLPWACSLCCLSKEFASKKREKFLDGQWSEWTHGKQKVAQLEWQLLLVVHSQSINFFPFLQIGILHKAKWSGKTWIFLVGGSYLTGSADYFGNLTGEQIAFLYPDLKHVLFGIFTKSNLSVAQFCYVTTVRFIKGHLPELTFSTTQGSYY